MAKRTTKKVNSNELDGQEFFAAIAQIEQEKGIKPGYMMEKITQALLSAYKKDHEGMGENHPGSGVGVPPGPRGRGR